MTEDEARFRRRLRDDLEFFMRAELVIRSKTEGVKPFVMNRAQRHLHERLEKQRRETGRVRAIILKGRQQGVSTYVAARFFHRTVMNPGLRTFIMTHHDDATYNLFEMVRRYHANLSDFVRPSTGAMNRNQLIYDRLSSGYQVATAGSAGAGRSSTIQLFHGSEVAFWANADDHAAGALQAVPDGEGTEVILESTANGEGNFYHKKWLDAVAKKSDYEPIFLPWTLQDEYATRVPDTVAFGKEDRDVQRGHHLTNEQLYWRVKKIREFGVEGLSRFKQEYPLSPDEAFAKETGKPYITAESVIAAMEADEEGYGPLIIGIDPGGGGAASDDTAVCRRVGRKVLSIETFGGMDTQQIAAWVRGIVDTEKPARVFLDSNGLGRGVLDRLREWGPPYSLVVRGVNSQTMLKRIPGQLTQPMNLRAQMWRDMKQWLEDAEAPADIPTDFDLKEQLVTPELVDNKSGMLQLEGKRSIKARRQKRSIDKADALALTFAEPVYGSDWKKAYPEMDDYGRGDWIRRPMRDETSPWAA